MPLYRKPINDSKSNKVQLYLLLCHAKSQFFFSKINLWYPIYCMTEIEFYMLCRTNFWPSRFFKTLPENWIHNSSLVSSTVWGYDGIVIFSRPHWSKVLSIFRTPNQISYVAAIIHLIWPNPRGPEIGATEPNSWRSWWIWNQIPDVLISGNVVAATSCEILKVSSYLLFVWNYCL